MKFPRIEHFPTNWEDGMRLGAGHFQHLENSIEDAIRDARSIGLVGVSGFGLIPGAPFQLMNAAGNAPNAVRVVLNACRAILPGGYRVEVLADNLQNKQIPVEPPFVEFIPTGGMRYHLFLSVNEEARVPAGIMESRPIRRPNLVYEYHIECVPHEKRMAFATVAPNRMKIAEWQDGQILPTYLPATIAIRGNKALEQWHQFFEQQLEMLVSKCTKIAHNHRDMGKHHFAVQIHRQIRGRHGEFKWVLPDLPPVRVVAYFGDLAGLVLGLIEHADRDFVRNELDNGNVHGLRTAIENLFGQAELPHEEVLQWFWVVRNFLESLSLTLDGLMTRPKQAPKSGERNIQAG